MDASINLAQSFLTMSRPENRATALQRVDELTMQDRLPTFCSLRELYGMLFEVEFWDRIGTPLRNLTVADLIPLRVNPLAVMAAQAYVNPAQVKTFLTMPPQQFGRLVTGVGNPQQPIILIRATHGFISINGHHRIRVLQLLNIRVSRMFVVPANLRLSKDLFDLTRRFGYIDMQQKWEYIRL